MTELGFVNEQTGRLFTVMLAGPRIVGFKTMQNGLPTYIPDVTGLKLNPSTIVDEHPDLEGKSIEEIKIEGVRRFKEHVASFTNEEDLIEYVKGDLEKHGFKLKMIHKTGHRPKVIR